MLKVWFEEAWDEYTYWQSQDKKTLRKINNLIKDIERNGYNCSGKPEPLKHNLAGLWSTHIDDQNRLVFRIVDQTIEIVSCKGHYHGR
jgi:toxin YoeB